MDWLDREFTEAYAALSETYDAMMDASTENELKHLQQKYNCAYARFIIARVVKTGHKL